jgi:glycosyltransferase involved in cell wall biosynthesis
MTSNGVKKPFFSIIIPTKNRPEFLRDAIKSVVLQDFDDYELIVSDNFNDERTKNVVEEFKGNSRLHYRRTVRELCHPDHWEFAAKGARGAYILLLTDRSFFRQGALKDVHSTVKSLGNPEVVFWKYGYFDEEKGILDSEKEEAGVKFFNSVDILKDFNRTYDMHLLPRPHVGCYRHDLVEKIRSDVGALYLPFGPDYTSSFLVLSRVEKIVFIPRPLFFFQGASVSQGTKSQSSISEYLKSLNMKDPYSHVPIKASINVSLIFNDFFKIRDIAGGNLKKFPFNWAFYFSKCYQELKEKKAIWKVDEKTLNGLWKEWRRALSSFDKETQRAVRRQILKAQILFLKSLLRVSPIGNFLARIKRFLLGKPTSKFESAFAAGGFK